MKSEQLENLPERVRGDWCDLETALKQDETVAAETLEDFNDYFLKNQWAQDLMVGDLKAAHKSWGRWQGFTGKDPWADTGWRNFLELQQFGERLWDDFDASQAQERVWLRVLISYWPSDSERA